MTVKPSAAINRILRGRIRALFKERGFLKKGRYFYIVQDSELLKFVEFEVERFSDRDTTSFTINVGGSHERLCRVFGQQFPSYPSMRLPRVQLTLSDLTGTARDTDWVLVTQRPSPDEPQIIQQVFSTLTTHVLPFLDSVQTIQHLYEAHQRVARLNRSDVEMTALLQIALDRRMDAAATVKAALASILQHGRAPELYCAALREFAQRYDLDLS